MLPHTSPTKLSTKTFIPTVKQTAITRYKHFHNQIKSSTKSPEIPGNSSCRLKKSWCRDLIQH